MAVLFGSGLMRTLSHDIMILQKRTIKKCPSSGQKKGDIYEGTVEKIEFPNKGILHIDGERVVVKNAIPGQKIQCVITKRRKGKSEARTLEILAHSPAEKPEEACPHFGRLYLPEPAL